MDQSIYIPKLFSLAPGDTDALDRFVGACLTSGGVWDHPRTSDGIANIVRVFDRADDGIGVCARIYAIDDQSLHTFWLEIKRDLDRIRWLLYIDPLGTSPRDFNAVHDHDRADDVEWRATLAGEATVVDGALLVVDESTSVSVQDVPDPSSPATHRRRRRR